MSVLTKSKSTVSANLDWDVLWERYGIATVLLIGWALAYLFVPKFSNPDNMLNVIRQSAFVGCAAVGMTMAIISGTFDLSIGSTLALSAYLGLMVVRQNGICPSGSDNYATCSDGCRSCQWIFSNAYQDPRFHSHPGDVIYCSRLDLYHLAGR